MFKFKNIYTTISRDVTVDANDRMTTLHKLIDFFNISYSKAELDKNNNTVGKDPILFENLDKFVISTSWKIDKLLTEDTEVKLRINIISPKGVELGGPEQSQVVPKNNNRFSLNFVLSSLPVINQGEYELRVSLLSTTGEILAVGSYDFNINLKED